MVVTWNHAICKGERRALFVLADELQYISCLLIMIEILVARFASLSLEFKWPVLQIEKLLSMHSADPTSDSMASRSALRSAFEFHLHGTGVSGRSHVVRARVIYDTEMTGASWSAWKIWDYPNMMPYFYMLVIHRQETTHRKKLKHFPRAKLLSNLHSRSYNQTLLSPQASAKPLYPNSSRTIHRTYPYVIICVYIWIYMYKWLLFQIVSSCTSKKPPHFKPHCNVRPLMVPGLCAKLWSFWHLWESYECDIWPLYTLCIYICIFLFSYLQTHTYVCWHFPKHTVSTIFICVLVKRSSSFAGSRPICIKYVALL